MRDWSNHCRTKCARSVFSVAECVLSLVSCGLVRSVCSTTLIDSGATDPWHIHFYTRISRAHNVWMIASMYVCMCVCGAVKMRQTKLRADFCVVERGALSRSSRAFNIYDDDLDCLWVVASSSFSPLHTQMIAFCGSSVLCVMWLCSVGCWAECCGV